MFAHCGIPLVMSAVEVAATLAIPGDAAAVVTPRGPAGLCLPQLFDRPRQLNCHGLPSVRRGGDAKHP